MHKMCLLLLWKSERRKNNCYLVFGDKNEVFLYSNQRKTIVNSWVRCLENNQLVITSGFPTANFRK